MVCVNKGASPSFHVLSILYVEWKFLLQPEIMQWDLVHKPPLGKAAKPERPRKVNLMPNMSKGGSTQGPKADMSKSDARQKTILSGVVAGCFVLAAGVGIACAVIVSSDDNGNDKRPEVVVTKTEIKKVDPPKTCEGVRITIRLEDGGEVTFTDDVKRIGNSSSFGFGAETNDMRFVYNGHYDSEGTGSVIGSGTLYNGDKDWESSEFRAVSPFKVLRASSCSS